MPTPARSTRLALAAVLLGAMACDNPAGPTEAVDVFTPGNTFSPFSTTVAAGGVVRFNIFGDKHDVTFSRTLPGTPPDIAVVMDTVVSRIFPLPGTFRFTCFSHQGMNGEIVVR